MPLYREPDRSLADRLVTMGTRSYFVKSLMLLWLYLSWAGGELHGRLVDVMER